MASPSKAREGGDVARYYDANTRRFLLVGPRGGAHAIHRELWAPGVTSAAEAVDHVNHLLAAEIRAGGLGADDSRLSILDLGCGVGGTLLRLARAFPGARLTGVTISRRQVEIARDLATRAGVSDRCTFLLDDIGSGDLGSGHDVAIAIESFVHLPGSPAFFESAARALRPGGALLVVDDFLARGVEALDEKSRRWVDDFRAGWRVPGLSTVEAARGTAEEAGFDFLRFDDLTPLVRTGRPRDRLIAVLAPFLRAMRAERMPFFGNMIGGDALQRGHRAGTLRYGLLCLRRAE